MKKFVARTPDCEASTAMLHEVAQLSPVLRFTGEEDGESPGRICTKFALAHRKREFLALEVHFGTSKQSAPTPAQAVQRAMPGMKPPSSPPREEIIDD